MGRLTVLLAVLAGLPLPASGQTTLTLETAVRDALARNPAVRAARASSSEADHRAAAARAAAWPRVSFVEAWQRGDQPVFAFSTLLASRRFAAADFAVDRLNHPDAIDAFRSSVTLEQVVFDGGWRRAAGREASAQRAVASAAVRRAEADLVVAVTQAFGRALAADAGVRAYEAGLAAAREDAARAAHRRDAGTATDADVLSLVAYAAGVEERLIRTSGDAAIARAELNRLMGTPVDRPLTPVEPAQPVAGASPSLTVLFEEAERTRPELAEAAARVQAAAAGRDRAQAVWYPRIAAQAEYGATGTRPTAAAGGWTVGAEARWTISLGGAELAQSRAAGDVQARTEAERDDVRGAIQLEIVSAVERLAGARARQAAGAAAIDQARERERVVRNRVDAGLASVTDLLSASSATLEAEAARAAAAVDVLVNDAGLRRAVGRIGQ